MGQSKLHIPMYVTDTIVFMAMPPNAKSNSSSLLYMFILLGIIAFRCHDARLISACRTGSVVACAEKEN